MPSSKVNGAVGEVAHCEEWSVEERALIVDEINRIVADPAFKSSKRCLALFSYLVDRSLAGDHDTVKERTLGVEVFGREPGYDTAMDPVVRMAANEIRKRLAQWYQEPAHHQRVRIRLNSGTYLLQFEFIHPEFVPEISEAKGRAEAVGLAVLPETEGEPQTGSSAQSDVLAPAPARDNWHKWIWRVVALAVVALAAVLTLRHFDVFQSRDYLVWKPLLNSTEPLTVSISEEPREAMADGALQWQRSADAIANRMAPAGTAAQNMDTITPMADVEVSQSITRWLMSHGQKPILRGSAEMVMRDLRQGPVILIGGFNPWSLILLSNLRYSIRVDPTTHAMWIQDAQNVSKRDWMIDGKGQPDDIDYAVISRLIDPETGHWILSLGGLRQEGTQAARDLLIDGSYAKLLPTQIRSTGNFQIVLKTSIVNGSADPPQIVAVHTW